MTKTSKIEVDNDGKEKLETTDKNLDATDHEIEQGDQAKDIAESNADVSLEDQVADMNSCLKELGNTVVDEVEQKAVEVDESIDRTIDHEKVLEDFEQTEQEAAENIRSQAAGLENAAFSGALDTEAAVRQEGHDFFADTRQNVEGERLNDTEQVRQQRDTASQIAAGMLQI